MGAWKLKQVVRLLKAGGIIAYPTEAVYGLGCDPWNPVAVARILELKQRPASKGLIIVASTTTQLAGYICFSDKSMQDRVLATWPGPVTWLLPAHPDVPPWIRGGHNTIAVRVSQHPLVRTLCTCAGPLVSTSANPAGYRPARSALKVINYFGMSLDYVLHGDTGDSARPTEIRDGVSGQIIRAGG